MAVAQNIERLSAAQETFTNGCSDMISQPAIRFFVIIVIVRQHTPDDALMSGVKIAAGLVFYNEIDCIRRCLASLTELDYVIAIDGKYDLNKGEPLSTDGSREIVKQFDNTILIDAPGKKQTDVRNMYMEKATKLGCDWVLVMEADEFVTNTYDPRFTHVTLDYFRSRLPVHNRRRIPRDLAYNVAWHEKGTSHIMWQRLLYKPKYIRYGRIHYSYVVNGIERMVNLNDNTSELVKGIVIHHDEKCRSEERQDASNYYGQRMLPRQEHKDRLALGARTL